MSKTFKEQMRQFRKRYGYESDIYAAIKEERYWQDAKWGEQRHSPWYWLCVLMEEVGEASKATIADTVNWKQYRKELVEVAAVAVAAIEDNDHDEMERLQQEKEKA